MGNPVNNIKKKQGKHWYAVATVCIGAFMAALDASIINVALPNLEKQFSTSMNEVEWVSLSYLISLASLILIFGRLADMLGRKWLYTIGFVIFSFSSLFCGLAPSLSILLGCRVLQGFGAAMLQANSVAIITAATPKEDLGKAIGFQASAQGIGLSVGPVAGGALLSFIGWKWLFFINLPIGFIGTFLGILFLPDESSVVKKHEKFDFIGALLFIPCIISIIYILNMGMKQGYGSQWMGFCYMIAVITFLLFIIYERKHAQPLVDFSLFKNVHFTMGNITGMMSFIVMYAVLLLTPYYLDEVKHLPILQASLLITAVPIGMTMSTPISGIMADQRGTAVPAMIGLSLSTIGGLMLSMINLTGTYILTCTGLFLVGAGIGMFTPPNNSSVMGNAPKKVLGVAGGILNMSRTLGMSLGITLGGLIFQFFLHVYGQAQQNFMLYAFRSSYFIVALFSLLTLIITYRNHKKELKHVRGYSSKQIGLD
ncbi:MFS transporter [Bacillus sp. BRMEA1]|uniref:MFS transporter n=1 Tax=Neobacillus endophyticus TaxID=2738405 RepID=UPI001567883F|nr:MFS transporter [Neobacillus endophyticus]NRD79669.1 MFS transporter [Neobacillus endophyticus]